MKVDIPNCPIALWDLPGAGTVNFPVASYVEDMHLAAMDMLVGGLVCRKGGLTAARLGDAVVISY